VIDSGLKKAILKTLAYADVFDYPLLKKEIWRFLIKERKEGELKTEEEGKGFSWELKELIKKSLCKEKKGFYFLPGREKIINLRKRRQKYSEKKIKIAEKIALILRKIPWVKMVGVTGALAMKNAEKKDDIDLLIIAVKNRLWLTRFFTVLLVEFFSKRRRPEEKEIKDKICLNMFLDEDHLSLPENERDLFSAHEVCQMEPIWEKDNCYQKFLKDNFWVQEFLPNAKPKKMVKKRTDKRKEDFFLIFLSFFFCFFNFSFFEKIARWFQLWYMRHRKTKEITETGRILFHPKDSRLWILENYKKRLKNLKIFF